MMPSTPPTTEPPAIAPILVWVCPEELDGVNVAEVVVLNVVGGTLWMVVDIVGLGDDVGDSENVGGGTVMLVITDNVVVMDVNHVEVMLIVV